MTIHILTLLIVAVIVYPKGFIPFGKLLSGVVSFAIKILTEFFKLFGVFIAKSFELLTTFFKWLISLF